MKKTLLWAVLTPMLAMAAPPPGPPVGKMGAPPDGAMGPSKRHDHERRMRLMMVVGLAEALGLSEAEAIRLADTMKRFDERRRPLREEMADQHRILKDAAAGDTAALAKVDEAANRLLEGRIKMAQLDKEMFVLLAKDLTPQKRAQLAVFLGRFKHEMRERAMAGPEDRGGRRSWHHQRGTQAPWARP